MAGILLNGTNYAGGAGGSGGGIDYSLEEQDTGLKWIDGKKIYQKTIDCGTLPNNDSKVIPHGISNLKLLVDVSGVVYFTDKEGGFLPINLPGESFLYTVCGNTAEIIIRTSTDRTNRSAFVTLRYTKTTD